MRKRCTRCEKIKAIEKFPQHTGGRYYSHCRECHNTQVRNSRRESAESRRQQTASRRAASRVACRQAVCDGKRCSKCKEFRMAGDFYKSKTSRDGLISHCKHCQKTMTKTWQQKNLKKLYEYNQTWTALNPDRVARYKSKARAKRGFNISAEEYAIHIGEGRCLICNELAKKPQLDHCHRTGKIRGVLCHSCNIGLGHFRDDPQRLKSAIAYLKKFSA